MTPQGDKQPAAAVAADQVVAVAVRGAAAVEPPGRLVAYDVHPAVGLQLAQGAVDGGQPDRVGLGDQEGVQLLGRHEVLAAGENAQHRPPLPGRPAAHGRSPPFVLAAPVCGTP